MASQTTVPTNDLGEYRLFDLRPGRYFVRADYKPNDHLIGRDETERTSGREQQGYVPMYYPGTSDPARASTLSVKAGEEIPGLEILMRPVPAFTVREPRGQDGLSQKVATDQYGHFLLRGIPPGEYQLFCWDEVEDGVWEDPDFLKAFENHGRRVSLKEADSQTVDIVVIETKGSL